MYFQQRNIWLKHNPCSDDIFSHIKADEKWRLSCNVMETIRNESKTFFFLFFSLYASWSLAEMTSLLVITLLKRLSGYPYGVAFKKYFRIFHQNGSYLEDMNESQPLSPNPSGITSTGRNLLLKKHGGSQKCTSCGPVSPSRLTWLRPTHTHTITHHHTRTPHPPVPGLDVHSEPRPHFCWLHQWSALKLRPLSGSFSGF